MPYRFHGRAEVNVRGLDSFAICDRCGLQYNHSKLSFQQEFAGAQLITYTVLVCDRCLDAPQEQKRVVKLPSDPVAVKNARPDADDGNNTNYLTTESLSPIAGETGNLFIID